MNILSQIEEIRKDTERKLAELLKDHLMEDDDFEVVVNLHLDNPLSKESFKAEAIKENWRSVKNDNTKWYTSNANYGETVIFVESAE